jgi:plastocyanin
MSAVLISTLTVVSCSSNSNPSNPSTGGSTPLTISIIGQLGNSSFSPNPADAGGKSVVFKNNDNVTHHVVLNDGTLDVGDIAPGATSRAVTMPVSGTNYHCSIHANMGGSVDPQGGGAPPPCEGVYCY